MQPGVRSLQVEKSLQKSLSEGPQGMQWNDGTGGSREPLTAHSTITHQPGPPQPPKTAALCLCPLSFFIRCTGNDMKTTDQITRQSRISKAQVEVDAQTLWWPPPGVFEGFWSRSNKMAPSGKRLPFHPGLPSNSRGWRSGGPLCFMEHKSLWIRALPRESFKLWKHWKAYVHTSYTQKNKKLHWQPVKLLVWFNLYFSLQTFCKFACLYWLVLWSQQYNFWTTLTPRITRNYSIILSKRHHNTYKEPGPSCWLAHALTLLLGFAENTRAKLFSSKV